MPVDDTSQSGDVSTAFEDVLDVPKRTNGWQRGRVPGVLLGAYESVPT